MSTGSMNYDHPVYTTPVIFSSSSAVGANGATQKFAAYTAMKIMSITDAPTIVTTAAGSQPLVYKKTGTTTTTTTLTALTSAATTTRNYVPTTPIALAQGDQFWYTHGTDAATSMSVAFECRVVPGSDVTIP